MAAIEEWMNEGKDESGDDNFWTRENVQMFLGIYFILILGGLLLDIISGEIDIQGFFTIWIPIVTISMVIGVVCTKFGISVWFSP